MQAPGIGGDATMSLVDNDVSKTVLHEFVYHGIKNMGFDESHVHVHVSCVRGNVCLSNFSNTRARAHIPVEDKGDGAD